MKSVAVLLAEGFEEIEALAVVDILRRAQIKCDICSLNKGLVTGSHLITVKSDCSLEDIDIDSYNAIVLPGGMPGSKNLKENKKVIEFVKKFKKEGKIIGAICAAPIVLKEAEVIKDINITSYPSFKEELDNGCYKDELVVYHNNIITGRGPGASLHFGLKLVEILQGEDISKKLREEMQIRFLEEYF